MPISSKSQNIYIKLSTWSCYFDDKIGKTDVNYIPYRKTRILVMCEKWIMHSPEIPVKYCKTRAPKTLYFQNNYVKTKGNFNLFESDC